MMIQTNQPPVAGTRRLGQAGVVWHLVRRAAVPATVAAVVVVLGLLLRPSGSSQQPSPLPGLHLGQTAPLFSLTSVDGTPLHLRSFRGRTVLLNFWATTCTPCRDEMPDLQRAFQSVRHDKAVIIGIDAANDDTGTVRRFAAPLHVHYPLVLDPLLSATIVAYHVAVLPTSVLVDPVGRLRMIHVGPMRYTQIAQALSIAK